MFQPPAWEVVETRTRGIAGPGKITNEYDALVSMSWISWNILVYTYIYIIYIIYNIYIYRDTHNYLWHFMNIYARKWYMWYMVCHSFEHNLGNANTVAKLVPNVLPISMCVPIYTVSTCLLLFVVDVVYCNRFYHVLPILYMEPKKHVFLLAHVLMKKNTQVNWARGIFNNHPIKYQTSLSSLDLGMVNYK